MVLGGTLGEKDPLWSDRGVVVKPALPCQAKKSLGSEYWRKINVVGLFGLKE